MVRWLERNGYDVSYFDRVDTDRRGAELLEHKAFLSVGHDEYWSGPQRANVEAARAAGVNLAFFSGNEVFWKTRWENTIDGSNTDHRTLVSYKETHANAKIDPTSTWTGTWRDPRFSPPADGGRPENALTGTIFMVNSRHLPRSKSPPPTARCGSGATPASPRWRRTRRRLSRPDTLGYEWDEELDNGFRPAGLVDLSTTTESVVPEAPRLRLHLWARHRDPPPDALPGRRVARWSSAPARSSGPGGWTGTTTAAARPPDARMQQATVNLLADMGVQPGTLQADLAPATRLDRHRGPGDDDRRRRLAAPNVEAGTPITISGTASDQTGETAAARSAASRSRSTAAAPGTRRPGATTGPTPGPRAPLGSATIKARAADDSGNLESPGAQVVVKVVAKTCPCSIWDSSFTGAPRTATTTRPRSAPSSAPTPPASSPACASTRPPATPAPTSGTSGRRRNPARPGNLQRRDGHRLAAGQLRRAGGDRRPNTTYIASYHAPNGHYASIGGYFALAAPTMPRCTRWLTESTGPTASTSTAPPARSSPPAGPTPSTRSTTGRRRLQHLGPDTTAPTIISRAPASGATTVSSTGNVTATFSEAMDPTNDQRHRRFPAARPREALSRQRSATRSAQQQAILDPTASLQSSTTYTATVKGGPGGVADAGRQPACRRLELVLHDRRAPAAAPGRRPRRPDPGDLERRQPVQPLLRRDPARRGPERVHGRPTSQTSRRPCSTPMTSRSSAKTALSAAPGADAERLGPGGRQPDRDAPRPAARRPARPHRHAEHARQRLPQGRHQHRPRRRHRRPDDPVPRHRRPLHGKRRPDDRHPLLGRRHAPPPTPR